MDILTALSVPSADRTSEMLRQGKEKLLGKAIEAWCRDTLGGCVIAADQDMAVIKKLALDLGLDVKP